MSGNGSMGMQTLAEVRKVSCPYCSVGFGLIEVERPDGKVAIRDRGHPKCSSCQRYFRLRFHIKIVGEPIPEEAARATGLRVTIPTSQLKAEGQPTKSATSKPGDVTIGVPSARMGAKGQGGS